MSRSGSVLTINANSRTTYDYLAEPRNRPQWQSSLRTVEVLTSGPTGIGTRWLDRTRVGATPTLEITVMTPPSQAYDAAPGVWTEVGHWRSITAALTLTFIPVAATQTRIGIHVDLAGSGRWVWPARALNLVAPPTINADLRRAKRIIEARTREEPRPTAP